MSFEFDPFPVCQLRRGGANELCPWQPPGGRLDVLPVGYHGASHHNFKNMCLICWIKGEGNIMIDGGALLVIGGWLRRRELLTVAPPPAHDCTNIGDESFWLHFPTAAGSKDAVASQEASVP